MPVPSPNIKPALVAGGVHRAIYMGAVGVSSSATGVDYARGIVRIHNLSGSPISPPEPGRRLTTADGRTYRILESAVEGENNDAFAMVQADQPGSAGNLPQGAALTFEPTSSEEGYYGPTATVEMSFAGGSDPVEGSSQLHLDLTAFSPSIRGHSHFADQLMVWIQPLDVGITDVQPQVVRAEDMHGTPPEYLTLTVANDDPANQWVVWVMAPHSHHR